MGGNAPGSGLLIIERILRDRAAVWRQIAHEQDLGTLIGQMMASSGIALFFYGAVLGASHSALQAALSAVKLPLLFLATLAICLPTLYLFNLVFGARLSVRQALALVLVTVTVTAALALAFAPISLFFLITAKNYSFYKLLNVAVLTLSAVVGLRFLTGGMELLNEHMEARRQAEIEAITAGAVTGRAHGVVGGTAGAPALAMAAASAGGAGGPILTATVPGQPGNGALPAQPGNEALPAQPGNGALPDTEKPVSELDLVPGLALVPGPATARRPAAGLPPRPGERPTSMNLLYIWILLFGFVGTQLAWTLRPFVGSPGEPFQVFREIDGNFYVDIVRTLGHLF